MNYHQRLLDTKYLQDDILFAYTIKTKLEEVLIREINNQEHIYNNALELASYIQNLLEVIDTHLKWEYHKEIIKLQNTSDILGQQRLKQRISESTRVVASLTPLLKFLDGASVQKNNWGVVTHIDRLCRKLYSNSRVIIRPRWEYNYTYLSITQELYNIANKANITDSSLQNALKSHIENAPYFFSLAYPPTAAKNILQLVLWSHELSHFIDHIEGFNIEKRNKILNQPSEEDLEPFSTDFVRRFVEDTKPQIDTKVYNQLLSILKISDSDPEILVEKFTSEVTEPLAAMISGWASEIFADLMSIKLMGPAPLFAFMEFGFPISGGLDTINDLHYPPFRLRLKFMLNEYDRWSNVDLDWTRNLTTDLRIAFEEKLSYIKKIVNSPLEEITFLSSNYHENQDFYKIFYGILGKMAESFVKALTQEIDNITNKSQELFITPYDFSCYLHGITFDLESSLPPTIEIASDESDCKYLSLLLNAGWLFWLSHRYKQSNNSVKSYSDAENSYEEINLLFLKSIETYEAEHWFKSRRSYGDYGRHNTNVESSKEDYIPEMDSGALSKKAILEMLANKSLRVIPMLDLSTQVGSCSLDVRLGNEFIVTKPPTLSSLNPVEFDVEVDPIQLQDKIYIPFGKPFVLHPGQFVLGSTLEYFKVPQNIMGLLIGRSSWGRLGLSIATPNKLNPGYKGCITLQITNLGNIPIFLYPCVRLGQIIFFKIG